MTTPTYSPSPLERLLLERLLREREIVVRLDGGRPGPSYEAARRLEDHGLFSVRQCAGTRKALVIRYGLTAAGVRAASGCLA